MKHLWFKLKSIELILNTSKLTKADVPYWEEERREVLKKILEYQLENFG